MRHPDLPADPGTSVAARLASVVVLAVPAALLGVAAARFNSFLLAGGAVAELVFALLFVRHRVAWRPPVSGSVILLYFMALAWLWFATRDNPDPFARAARGTFVLGAVGLIACHDLIRSGVEPRRRAHRLCRQLLARKHWPANAAGYAALPEVRGLRDALEDDPGPALDLLTFPKPELKTAAFVALQPRTVWRSAEAATVLVAAQTCDDAGVRAAGVAALAGVADPIIVGALSGFLRDPSADVRRAAAEAVLAGGERRWPLARDGVREALADPTLSRDGALPGAAGRLTEMAVCDLTTWAAEPEPLASRSVRTLIGHFADRLRAGDRPELPSELAAQIVDPYTPPILRVELAGMLRGLDLIPVELLDRMTDADQPGPIRLFAAETILSRDPANADAIDVLRGLGRQSNRETVLAIARLVQTYLGIDMGVPADQKVAVNSKAAAEAAKRVFQWATGRAALPDGPAEAGSAWVNRPVQRAALPGLKATAQVPPKPDTFGASGSWSPRK